MIQEIRVGGRPRRRATRALLIVTAVLAVPAPARGDTLSFTGAFSRDWNTAANWTASEDPGVHAVPSAADDVQIPFGTAPELANGADGAVASIALDAGASLSVSGRALAIGGNGPSTLDGDVDLSAATLHLAGALTWGEGDWSLSGATVTNTGALRITGDVAALATGAGGRIANSGTIIRDDAHPDTGTAAIAAPLDNAGRIVVAAGRADLVADGAHTGSFIIGPDAVLASSGDQTLGAGAAVMGAGTLQLDDGTFRVPSTVTQFAPGTLLLSGGYVDLGKLTTIARLTSDGDGGGRRGTGALFAGGPTVLDNVSLDSGQTTLNGPEVVLRGLGVHGSTLNLQPGTQTVWDAGSWELQGATVNNFGHLLISGDGSAELLGDQAFVNNRLGATLTRADADPETGAATLAVGVKNDGRIAVDAGVLALAGAGVEPSGGTFALGAAGTLSIATGFELERGGDVTGPGTLRLDDGALSVPAGDGRFDPATVLFSGGYLDLDRDATVARLTSDGEGGGRAGGVATLNAGGPTVLDDVLLFGPGTTNLSGPDVTLRDLTVTGGGVLRLAAATKTVWDAGTWQLGDTLVINAGELRITGDGAALDTGGMALVENVGTIVRDDADPSAGVATFAAHLHNRATVEVARGSLDLAALGDQDAGRTTVDAGATLGSAEAVYVLSGGRLDGAGRIAGTLENAGATVAPAGVLTVDGAYAQQAGGRLAIDIAAATHDELAVTGRAALAGTLDIATANDAVAPAGSSLDVLTADTLSGSFTTVTGDAEGRYTIEYATVPGRVTLRVGGVPPEPPSGDVPVPPPSVPGAETPTPSVPRAETPTPSVPRAETPTPSVSRTETPMPAPVTSVSTPASTPLRAPANLTRPLLTGTPRTGRTLRCAPGTWTGAPALSFSWLRDGARISGQIERRYRLRKRDAGQRIACRVRARNAAGVTTRSSAAVRPHRVPRPRSH